MATLTVQTVDRVGFSITDTAVAAAGGGDKFANTGVEFLAIVNGGVGSITLTLVFNTVTVDGVTPVNKTVTVANGKTKLVGPFPPSWYSDVNGFVNFTYSGVTSVTVAALKIGS